MKYVNDWDMIKKRFTAWWDGEIIDRCCASITFSNAAAVDKDHILDFPKDKDEIFKFWTDPEQLIKRNRLMMENSWYGGEAFPLVNLNMGASGHAGFFKGADFAFADTVWFFPSAKHPDEIEFDENSFLFKKTLEIAKALADDSKGDYGVSVSDSSGNIDALSHLLGPEELLPLMIEEPEAVKAGMEKIQVAYEAIHRRVYDIVKDINDGGSSTGWLHTWAPGLHAQLQSDASVMISNAMYREFIEPELRTQCDMLDYPLYHFDGIEQLRHLDTLLSIEKLRTIQWTQDAGQPPCTEFFPQLQKIQKAGKNLLIWVEPEQVKPIMENLSSKGLFLLVNASSKEEGEDILKYIAKVTHE